MFIFPLLHTVVTYIYDIKHYFNKWFGHGINNIVAAFWGMHVSPAKHSYAWLPRKCDYRTHTHRQTDGRTDRRWTKWYLCAAMLGRWHKKRYGIWLKCLRCMFDMSYWDVKYNVIYVICSHYVRKAISPLSLGPAHFNKWFDHDINKTI